jgi:hypothetical protein
MVAASDLRNGATILKTFINELPIRTNAEMVRFARDTENSVHYRKSVQDGWKIKPVQWEIYIGSYFQGLRKCSVRDVFPVIVNVHNLWNTGHGRNLSFTHKKKTKIRGL